VFLLVFILSEGRIPKAFFRRTRPPVPNGSRRFSSSGVPYGPPSGMAEIDMREIGQRRADPCPVAGCPEDQTGELPVTEQFGAVESSTRWASCFLRRAKNPPSLSFKAIPSLRVCPRTRQPSPPASYCPCHHTIVPSTSTEMKVDGATQSDSPEQRHGPTGNTS